MFLVLQFKLATVSTYSLNFKLDFWANGLANLKIGRANSALPNWNTTVLPIWCCLSKSLENFYPDLQTKSISTDFQVWFRDSFLSPPPLAIFAILKSDIYCFSKTWFLHNWRPREEKNGRVKNWEERQQAAQQQRTRFQPPCMLIVRVSASLSSLLLLIFTAAWKNSCEFAGELRGGKSTLKLLQLNSICHFIIVTVSVSSSVTLTPKVEQKFED